MKEPSHPEDLNWTISEILKEIHATSGVSVLTSYGINTKFVQTI